MEVSITCANADVYWMDKLNVIFTWQERKRNIEEQPEEMFKRKQALFLLSLYVVHLDESVWILL